VTGLCFICVTVWSKHYGRACHPQGLPFYTATGFGLVVPCCRPSWRCARQAGRAGKGAFKCFGAVATAIGVILVVLRDDPHLYRRVTAMNYLAPIYVRRGALFWRNACAARIIALCSVGVGRESSLRPGFRELTGGHSRLCLDRAVVFAGIFACQ